MKATTKLAIRASISIFFAELITQSFGLFSTKGYWCVMTVLIIIGLSLGESMSKGYQRLSTTISGAIFGGIVIFLIGKDHLAIYSIILLLACFLTFLLMSYTYDKGVFFLTFSVMILYQMIGEWNSFTVFDRISETLIAFVIVIIVSKYVFPESVLKKMRNDFSKILNFTINYRKYMVKDVLLLKNTTGQTYYWDSLAYGKKLISNLNTVFFSFKFEYLFNKNIQKGVKRNIKYFSDILYEMEEIESILKNQEILADTKEIVIKYFVIFKFKQDMLEEIFKKPSENKYLKLKYIKLLNEKNKISTKEGNKFLKSNIYSIGDQICITELFYYLNRINKNLSGLIALTCMIRKNKKLSI